MLTLGRTISVVRVSRQAILCDYPLLKLPEGKEFDVVMQEGTTDSGDHIHVGSIREIEVDATVAMSLN